MKIFLFLIKEEGEFKQQKAQKNFLTRGENRTRDPNLVPRARFPGFRTISGTCSKFGYPPAYKPKTVYLY